MPECFGLSGLAKELDCSLKIAKPIFADLKDVRLGARSWAVSKRKIREFVESGGCAVENPPVRENRVEGDGKAPQRTAKESVGLGKHAGRGRKGPKKQNLQLIDGGAESLDVQEIRK